MLCHVPYTDPPSYALPLDEMLTAIAPVAAGVTLEPHPGETPDLDQARASLANAWGTELLLAFGGEVASEDELMRLMNNWAVVQAYYASYHAIQAVVVGRGKPRPETHPKTQAQFADHWANRTIQLPPWSLAAASGGWRNAPREIDDVHPWSGCDTHSCLDLAAKAERTTRDDKVREGESNARDRKRAEAKRVWKLQEAERLERGKRPRKEPGFPRPILKVEEKRAIRSRIRPFTVLDYLYRLRVKANYEDASMFVDGPTNEAESLTVHSDLVELTSATLLVHELQVGSCVGGSKLVTWADEWIARNAAGARVGLGQRRDLIAAYCD
jgi:hypothetical protein